MKVSVTLFLLLVAGKVLAQVPSPGTFGDLVQECYHQAPEHAKDTATALDANHDDGYAQGYCLGVLGTAISLLEDSGKIKVPPDPTEVPTQRAKTIIKEYLDKHSAESQGPAVLTLKKALEEKWGN
jgi:hypothetical protein